MYTIKWSNEHRRRRRNWRYRWIIIKIINDALDSCFGKSPKIIGGCWSLLSLFGKKICTSYFSNVIKTLRNKNKHLQQKNSTDQDSPGPAPPQSQPF